MLFLNLTPSVSSKDTNFYLDYFYLEGCSGCEDVKPTIETIDLLYPELTVLSFNMDLTPRPMPLSVIISGEDYTYINYFKFSKDNVTNAVDEYLETNNEDIIIEYLFRDITSEYNRTKKIIEELKANNSERIIIKEFRLETVIPLIILRDKDFENYKKFEFGTISRDKIINTIEEFKATQKKSETKENNLSITNLETILIIAIILSTIFISLFIVMKKYKKK